MQRATAYVEQYEERNSSNLIGSEDYIQNALWTTGSSSRSLGSGGNSARENNAEDVIRPDDSGRSGLDGAA